MKIRNRTGRKTDPCEVAGHQVEPGLDLRQGHLIPLFESTKRATSRSTYV